MEEFKDFLPELAGPGASQGGGLVGIMPHPQNGGPSWEQMGEASSADGGKAPNRRRKRGDKEPPPPPPPPQQKTMGGRVSVSLFLRVSSVQTSCVVARS